MDKNLLILGASSDIGICFIKRNFNEFNKIYAHYNKNKEELEEIKQKYKLDMEIIPADFSNDNDMDFFIKRLVNTEENVNQIIHLAAEIVEPCKFIKSDWEVYKRSIDIQVKNFYKIIKVCLPNMIKNKEGSIVSILTEYVEGVPPKYLSSYVTAKYALMGFMKSLAVEYAAKNIRFNMISPAMADTKFIENLSHIVVETEISKIPMKKLISKEAIANAILFFLKEESSMITGNNLLLTGGHLF